MKKYIAITRPEPQASQLFTLLQQHGYASLVLPALQIQYTPKKILQHKLSQVAAYDSVIFLSQHAVVACDHALQSLPATASFIAIGPATARSLQTAIDQCSPKAKGGNQYALSKVTVKVAAEFNSEGLLAMPQLQQVQAKTFHIFSAEHARGLVGQELAKRGATVNVHPCYTYTPPTHEVQQRLRRALAADELSLVVTTSCYALDQLFSICQPDLGQALQATPLLVTSPRISSYAQQLGWTHILQASAASEAAILHAVSSYL